MHLNFEKLSNGWLHGKSSAVWRKTKRGSGREGLGWAPSGERAGVEPLGLRRPGTQPPCSPRPELWSRACVLRSKRPTQRPAPENTERGGGGAQEGRRAGGVGGWVLGAGDVDATSRSAGGRPADTVPRWHPDPGRRSLGTRPFREPQPRRESALNTSSPASRLPTLQSRRGGQRPSGSSGARLGASGRGRAPRGGRLGGRGRGRSPERLGGRGRGRGSAAPRAAAGARGTRQGPGGAMAAGSITTLPALPEDGGSGAFPPGHFKDPKRLYCKNGGFFLRIHPDGRVDGVREKSDPHSECRPPPPGLSLRPCHPTLRSDPRGTCGFSPRGPRRIQVHHSRPSLPSCGVGFDAPPALGCASFPW